jgi:hypothetical protein
VFPDAVSYVAFVEVTVLALSPVLTNWLLEALVAEELVLSTVSA